MSKITLVVAYFLLSISAPSAFPQSATLRGTITDAQSGNPLANANIVLNSTSEPNRRLGTNSDSNGAYEIQNIPTGSYVLAVSFIGYKISGNFIQGGDFESHDAFEDSVRARLFALDRSYRERGLPNPDPLDANDKRIGRRDFKIEKYGANARIDYRFNDDLYFNLNTGFNMASDMELTDVSAALVDDWRYLYGQAKLIYKNLFAQAYVNSSNSGKTYLTRDGADLVDRSKFYALQIQNTSPLGGRQVFTYGFDAMLTRPVTEGTVNGVHEDDDAIDEFGIYLQSETDFSEKFKLVLAGRLDSHNRLEAPFFSPRAGIRSPGDAAFQVFSGPVSELGSFF